MLDLSKTEDHLDEEAHLTPVNFSIFAESCRRLIDACTVRERAAGYDPGDVTMSVSPTIPRGVMLDSARVTQVLINFVSNAIKYGDSPIHVSWDKTNEVPPSRVGNLSRKDDASFLMLEVSDAGDGPQKDSILDALNPLQPGRDGHQQLPGSASMGLGLPICGINALRMQGACGFYRSSDAKRSVFFMAVPLKEATVSTPKVLRKKSSSSKAKILAVDDQQMNLLILGRMLLSCGYERSLVRSKEEAIEALRKDHDWDLMLLDFQLGDNVTALDVLKQMQDEQLTPPKYGVLIVSAHALTSVRQQCRAASCVGYVTKPFSKEKIQKAVAEVLCGGSYWQD